MKLYSTNNPSNYVGFKEALFKGLPEDNGLYMPLELTKLPDDFIKNLAEYSFQDISFRVAYHLLQDSIPEKDLAEIIESAISFPAPLVNLDQGINILELFHGPSLAFKDFGARFMAKTMGYFNQQEDKDLVILVATSGDTGGAVAAGFYNTHGIKVVILYPSGKVSPLQEKQLTTLGKNISALEVKGNFDDCQALVKKAFLDNDLRQRIRLSSANSINIARLIPQSFYYFEAYKQLMDKSRPTVFCVPSGNFGNLTAGLIAKRLGLPIHHFIAATNSNRVVPEYLKTGISQPMPSIPTLSNAMDVGDPSNFARMMDLYCSTWNNVTQDITGYSFDDEATKNAIHEVYEKHEYIIDPHGAVGYLALKRYLQENNNTQGIILETAHPSKFLSTVESVLEKKIEIPARLANLADSIKEATLMNPDYDHFKEWLAVHY